MEYFEKVLFSIVSVRLAFDTAAVIWVVDLSIKLAGTPRSVVCWTKIPIIDGGADPGPKWIYWDLTALIYMPPIEVQGICSLKSSKFVMTAFVEQPQFKWSANM